MKNTTAKRRDFIFFLLMIVMIKVALDKKQLPQADSSLFAPANNSTVDNSPFHEPDHKLMERLTSLRNQTQKALQAPDLEPHKEKALLNTQKRLSYLLDSYTHSSPALALLGPIASTGIVLKEQSIEKELNEIEARLADLRS